VASAKQNDFARIHLVYCFVTFCTLREIFFTIAEEWHEGCLVTVNTNHWNLFFCNQDWVVFWQISDNVYNFHSNSLIFLGAVLKQVIFP